MRLKKGDQVYRPIESGKKRKRQASPEEVRKKPNLVDYGTDESDDSSDASEDESSAPSTAGPVLTEADINAELAEFSRQKVETRKSKKAITGTLSEIGKALAQAAAEEAKLRSEIKLACIKGRNDHSRQDLKRDFAKGIQE